MTVAGSAYLAACGDDDDKEAPKTGASSSSSGGGGDAKFNVGAPRSDESAAALQERYHGKHLKELPTQKDGPKQGGVFRRSGNLPPSWDPAGPSGGTIALNSFGHNQLIAFQVGDFQNNPHYWTLAPDIAKSWEQADPLTYTFRLEDRKSTRLNSSHIQKSRMPSSA